MLPNIKMGRKLETTRGEDQCFSRRGTSEAVDLIFVNVNETSQEAL